MEHQPSSVVHPGDPTPDSPTLHKRKRRSVTTALEGPTKQRKFTASHQPDPPTTFRPPVHGPEQFATSRLALSFAKSDTTPDLIGANRCDPNALPPVPSREYHDSLPLAAKDFFGNKQLTLSRACRKQAFIRECVSIKLLEELEIFREAVRSEVEDTRTLPYKAQQAVALARAIRDTQKAEKDLAEENVKVAKLLLAAEEDDFEEALGRLNAAESQYGAFLYAMRTQNLGSDWAQRDDDIYLFKPQTRHQERWPYPGAMENESVLSGESDVESLDLETSDHTHDEKDA